MPKHRYGLVFDAGSSGTRVYVYRWQDAQHARHDGDRPALRRLPRVKTKKRWVKKVQPGISALGGRPEAVAEYLKPLVAFAQDIVPAHEVQRTPVFLLATAGMRLLPDHQRASVLQYACSYFRHQTAFQLPDCGLHVQVIPGETEALYGWIAANYLLGGFDAPAEHDHGSAHHTYGFLDMGGASAQIAFAPNATEAEKHAADLKLLRLRTVGGQPMDYRVFVTTWLGFGANEARRRYVTRLLEASPTARELPDPCLPMGIKVDKSGGEIASGPSDGAGTEPYMLGTGDFTQCLKATYPLLEKERQCQDAPCLLNGQHTPAIDFHVNHFVGVSEYWHTTHEIFAMAHRDKAYDFQAYQKRVTEFCSRPWKDIKKDVVKQAWGHAVDAKTVEEVCFKASWLINMLHEGIGVPRVGIEASKTSGYNKTSAMVDSAKDRGFLHPFQAVDQIDGTEVSWTLGKIVLYASSQMPPADEALAVGFGSNAKTPTTLPPDWQYPAGRPDASPTNASAHFEEPDWHDRILTSSYSRRVPGILIFLLIIVLAIYLLCGRERRRSWYARYLGAKPRPKGAKKKRPSPLGGKLFGTKPAPFSYERVLEEADLDELELADVVDPERLSDSSHDADAVRIGRTSGLVTPAMRCLSPDVSRHSPIKPHGYFDGPFPSTPPGTFSSSSHGLGIGGGGGGGGGGITPFDRSGLLARSESSDRSHAPPAPGSRSRRTSPTRKTPLMTPFKESVD